MEPKWFDEKEKQTREKDTVQHLAENLAYSNSVPVNDGGK